MRATIVLGALVLRSVFAHAATIDFNTLSGSQGDPFVSYTEDGFTVTGSLMLVAATDFGNPVPAIFNMNGGGSATVITTGLFTFSSVDIGQGPGSNPFAVLVDGFLGTTKVFQIGGLQTNSLTTYTNPDPSQLVDSLKIFFNPSNFGNDYIDNIVVNGTTPEPGTIGLLSIGLVALFCGRNVALMMPVVPRSHSKGSGTDVAPYRPAPWASDKRLTPDTP